MSDPSIRQMSLTGAESTIKELTVKAEQDLLRRLRCSGTSHEELLLLKGEAQGYEKIRTQVDSALRQNK